MFACIQLYHVRYFRWKKFIITESKCHDYSQLVIRLITYTNLNFKFRGLANIQNPYHKNKNILKFFWDNYCISFSSVLFFYKIMHNNNFVHDDNKIFILSSLKLLWKKMGEWNTYFYQNKIAIERSKITKNIGYYDNHDCIKLITEDERAKYFFFWENGKNHF